MNQHYDILDRAIKVPFSDITPLLDRFIGHAVVPSKRERWLMLSRKPKKLFAKFTDLWNSLDTTKSVELPALNLSDREFIYYCMDEHGYHLNSEEASLAADAEDGFLFDRDSSKVIFATHESEYFEFTIPNRG